MHDTCRPSGALVFAYPVRYKHAAPLGLNAKTGKRGNGIVLIRVSIVGTTIVVANRLPYTAVALGCGDSFLLYTCRPAGAKCEDGKTRKRDSPNKNRCIVGTTIVVPYNSFALAVPPRLGVVVIRSCYTHTAPLGLNAPMECFSCSTFDTTLRSAGVRGLASSRFYRHIARLEEKQANHSLPLRPNHGGLVSKPDGLGDPTPTHLTPRLPIFTFHVSR